jgi:hypothetical protein
MCFLVFSRPHPHPTPTIIGAEPQLNRTALQHRTLALLGKDPRTGPLGVAGSRTRPGPSCPGARTPSFSSRANKRPPGDFRARAYGPSSKATEDDGPGDPAPFSSSAALRRYALIGALESVQCWLPAHRHRGLGIFVAYIGRTHLRRFASWRKARRTHRPKHQPTEAVHPLVERWPRRREGTLAGVPNAASLRTLTVPHAAGAPAQIEQVHREFRL